MHEIKTFVTELLIFFGNLSLYFNANPETIRPYPWLMHNVTKIVKTRKEENVIYRFLKDITISITIRF